MTIARETPHIFVRDLEIATPAQSVGKFIDQALYIAEMIDPEAQFLFQNCDFPSEATATYDELWLAMQTAYDEQTA